jgi:hypothetical protein
MRSCLCGFVSSIGSAVPNHRHGLIGSASKRTNGYREHFRKSISTAHDRRADLLPIPRCLHTAPVEREFRLLYHHKKPFATSGTGSIPWIDDECLYPMYTGIRRSFRPIQTALARVKGTSQLFRPGSFLARIYHTPSDLKLVRETGRDMCTKFKWSAPRPNESWPLQALFDPRPHRQRRIALRRGS